MSHRRQLTLMLSAIALAGSALVAGFLLGRSGQAAGEGDGDGAAADDAVAPVTTAPATRRELEDLVSAYGAVVPAPDAVQSVAAPFECRVRRILARAGQRVEAGQAILEIAPSPGTALELAEGRSNRESAKADLQQVQQRADLKLATRQELMQAEQTLDIAELRFDSLRRSGAGVRRITAVRAGTLREVSVREGDLVPPFGPLAELVPEDSIEVRLGVDPGDLDRVAAGQPVHLVPVLGAHPAAIEGRVRLVSEEINPASRLVDVYVSIPGDAGLPLDTYAVGDVVVASRAALAVPRQAVLPEGERDFVFTVEGGRAKRRDVAVGLFDADWVEVSGGGLSEGQRVVVSGNYELEDGMAVAEGRSK